VNDDPLEDLARRNNILYFRGSEEDVLERYLKAAEQFSVEFAIVTWGDEVFCDPFYVDETIRRFYRDHDQPDMITSDSLPEGTYTYGVRIESLRQVVKEKSQSNTEVWTKYFANNPRYRVAHLEVASEVQRRDLRLTQHSPSAAFSANYRATTRPTSPNASASMRACAWPGCRRADFVS